MRDTTKPLALVIGAGGASAAAAYAALALGLQPVFANRTQARAQELALRFDGRFAAWSTVGQQPTHSEDGSHNIISALDMPTSLAWSFESAQRVVAIIHTLPSSAGWLPAPALLVSRPVIFDCSIMADAHASALATIAQGAGCEFVVGRMMLVLQAAVASSAWRGGAAGLLRGGMRGAARQAADSGAAELAGDDDDVDLATACVMARVAGV